MNYSFLLSLNPVNVAIKGVLLSIIVYIVTPAYVTINLSIWPFIYLILAYVSLFAGCYSIPIKNVFIKVGYKLSEKRKKRILYVVMTLALIGIGLRLFERIFIRGIVIGGDIFENRENLETSSTSLVGVISTLLYPLAYFSFFWYLYCKYTSKILLVCLFVMFFFPTIDSYLIGSRSMILQNLVVLGLMGMLFNKKKISLKAYLLIFASICLVILLFALILYNRLGGDSFNFDFSTIATLSDYNFTFAVKPEYLTSIENESDNFIKLLKFMVVNVGQYMNHGIFEFNYLFTNYNPQNIHDWGRNNLFLYYRFYDVFFPSATPRPSLAVREAVYTTFFGEVFIDFGWWGMIFMYFLGLIVKFIYVKILNGNVFLIPMYFVFVYIIFLMPTSNLLSGGMGLITINALLIPYFIYKVPVIVNKLNGTLKLTA